MCGLGVNASQLDSLQRELERSNAEAIKRHKVKLVSMLAGDALQPAAQGGTAQAVALFVLGALVATDDTTDVAHEIYAKNIPTAILDSLVNAAPKILLQPSHKSQVSVLLPSLSSWSSW